MLFFLFSFSFYISWPWKLTSVQCHLLFYFYSIIVFLLMLESTSSDVLGCKGGKTHEKAPVKTGYSFPLLSRQIINCK